MSQKILSALALAASLAGTAAAADQFVAQLAAPFGGARAGLLDTLRIVEIETFDHEGRHYIVLQAPSDGHVEAYFHATGLRPVALHTLKADWIAPGLADLPLGQRLPFLTWVPCDYCLS